MTPEVDELTNRQIKRLRWTAEKGMARLVFRYGKMKRSALTLDEKKDFLQHLESLSE